MKTRNLTLNRNLKAFTLEELLVVLVIIGILILIAMPVLMPLISKAKSTEAQMQLGHIYTLEKNYFYMYSRYTNDLDLLGYEQPLLVPDGGNANYRIEIVEADEKSFRARAVAVVDFDGDGSYNIWEIDHNKQLIEVAKD